MAKTAKAYWQMVLRRAGASAMGRARSWSYILLLLVTIGAVIGWISNEQKAQLAWQVPVALIIGFVATFVPVAIHESYHELELRSDEQMVGKWFQTVHDDGSIKYTGKVLENRGGRNLIQLFSAIDGEPTTRRFMSVEEAETSRFFDSQQELEAEVERMAPPRLDFFSEE